MPVLYYLLLVRPQAKTSTSHTVRWDGMERHDRLTTPAYGTSDEQGRDVEAKAFLSSLSLSLSLSPM